MITRLKVWYGCVHGLLILALPAYAVDPRLDWHTLESTHFRIHFQQEAEALAYQCAQLAESLHAELSQHLQWTPTVKTEIVLDDSNDSANGAATPIPFNTMSIRLSPPMALDSLEDYDDWLRIILEHEYTHILHLDKARGAPRVLRSILGRFSLLFPNAYQPGWMLEGLATYQETHQPRGVGRGQSSLFAMMMRMEVKQGPKPLKQISMPIRTWPGGHTAYLYGVHFYQFIEARYGADKLRQFIHAYSDNLIPFLVNRNAKVIAGTPLKVLWEEYEAYLRARYEPQHDQFQQQTLVAGTQLTQTGHKTSALHALSDGHLYFIRDSGYSRPVIVRLSPDGHAEIVAEVHPGARIDIRPDHTILIAQSEVCEEYGFYYDLYLLAPQQKYPRRLTHCGRYTHGAWHPNGDKIAVVHNKLGQNALLLLDLQGQPLQTLWQGENHEVLSQLDWSPDGKFIVAAIWRAGRWNLERFDLQANTWLALSHDDFIQAQPRYSLDGRWIYYTADYEGIYNLYRLATITGNIEKLSHVEGGAFEPAPAADDTAVHYIGYHAQGYDLYRLAKPEPLTQNLPHDITPEQLAPTPPLEQAPLPVYTYRPWQSLTPRWWLPVIGGNASGITAGATTGGNDALGLHHYALGLAYETSSEATLGHVQYLYNDRFELQLQRSSELSLNEDDEIMRARIHDEFSARYHFPLTRYQYQWRFSFNVSTDHSFDKLFSETLIPQAEFKDNLLGSALSFDNSQQFNFGISPNRGRHVRLVLEDSDSLNGDFSGNIYTLDWREYLSLGGEHALALRWTRGWGTQQPRAFRLGGENEQDIQLFNARSYNLRGYSEGLQALRGRRMQLAGAEWRFPLARIERTWLMPPLGISQLSGNFFIESGAAWDDGSTPEKYYHSAGLELNADVVLGYGPELRLRGGFARGFDEILGDKRFYFSLGAAF